MNETRRRRLESQGWTVGDAAEFLELTPEDLAWITIHESLSAAVVDARRRSGLTQTQLATSIGSSQSRIAKLEAGDPGVSFDLMIRALVALGWTPERIGRAIAARGGQVTRRTAVPGARPRRARLSST